MDRRRFVKGTLGGVAGWAALERSPRAAPKEVAGIGGQSPAASPVKGPAAAAQEPKVIERSGPTLFPTTVPNNEWVRMGAEGFAAPACGVVYRLDHPAWLTRRKERPNGMPVGGIDTGCIDLEKNGTLGFMSIFNSHVPRRGPLNLPYLGLSVGDKTWILADVDGRHVSSIGWATAYYFAPEKVQDGKAEAWTAKDYYQKLDWQVSGVDQIHYWGHYPVADLEYEITRAVGEGTLVGANFTDWGKRIKAPISVGLRAWSPFIPGDVETSQMPGAVFAVQVRNITDQSQKGTLAFTFPGPSLEESEGATAFPRHTVKGKFSGVTVSNGKEIGYALGAVGEAVRTGGELGSNGEAWAQVAHKLPPVIAGQPGASAAVDFTLQPGEEKTIRFVLSWYSPQWKGGGTLTAGGRTYTHMYSTHYQSALQVANLLAEQHEPLLKRVLAWQQAVYTADEIPVWLRESLVNILHLLTENTFWATAQPPIGSWCRPEDGLVGMIGNARDCPLMEAITEAFYANIPLVYFFPEMAISTLRGYKAYQNPDGSIPFSFSRTPTAELAADFALQYQASSNGVIYAVLVDRYWQCTGDDAVVKEFYPSVKKNVIFTMNLNTDPDGVISAPTGDVNRGDGFISFPSRRLMPPGKGLAYGGEHNGVFGMNTHLGGLHLAQLRIVKRMAEKVGDDEFAARCEAWLQSGTDSLENKMWAGTYYLNTWEPAIGKKSDLIYAYQLEGEWVVRYHGLPGVFHPDRVHTALDTIQKINGSISPIAPVMFAAPGGATSSEQTFDRARDAAYGGESIFVSDSFLLAATHMFAGQVDVGSDTLRRVWHDIVCQQEATWQQPNLLRGDTGEVIFGWDYYQNLGIWMVPPAMTQTELAKSNKTGTLVDRVLQAGKRT